MATDKPNFIIIDEFVVDDYVFVCNYMCLLAFNITEKRSS